MVVAKTTGWSEEELTAMPEPVFESYLRIVLKAHGVNPDLGDVIVGAPPPKDGAFELPDDLRAALAEHGVVPSQEG